MRRPRRLTALAVLFAALAFTGALRAGEALAQWGLLGELGAWPGPAYLAAYGLAWLAVGAPLALGLWARQVWARRLALPGMAAVLVTALADTWIAARASGSGWPPTNGLYLAGLALALLAFTAWCVVSHRKNNDPHDPKRSRN